MDELIVQGRMSQGYGIVPKLVMRDQNLTIQAKAIYSYFCSYAGTGTTAFPTVNHITYDLKISRDTYNKHLKLLKQYGYIKIEQQRNEKGIYSKNIYTLCEIIETGALEEKNSEPKPKKPTTDLPTSEKPTPDLTVAAELDSNNNSIYNNNNININSYKNKQTDSQTDIKKVSSHISDNIEKPTTNPISNYNTTKALIQENIEYNTYLDELNYFINLGDQRSVIEAKGKIAIINDFISIMLDTIFTKSDIKIKDELKSSEIVASKFLEIDHDRIEIAYNNFVNTNTKITNKTNFIRSMLYITCLEYESNIMNFAISTVGGVR